jgi:hypothetical protein
VVSGVVDHPVFGLVCNATTGIPNWSEVIWDNSTSYDRNSNVRHTTWVGSGHGRSVSMQMQFHSRLSKDWRVSPILDVEKDVPLNEECTDLGGIHFETLF